jgi:PAS domain S-box-containing protein
MTRPADKPDPARPVPLRRYIPVVLTLIAGVLVSGVGMGLLRDGEWRSIQAQFARTAEAYTTALNRELQTNLLILEVPRSFFCGSEEVTRAEFHVFTKPFLTDQAEALAWEWLPRVTHSQRAPLEEQARREGVRAFTICERNAQKQIVPAARREEYFPVQYIEPVVRFQASLGFDMATEPLRMAAMCAARDRGTRVAVVGGPVIHDVGPSHALLVFLPVYRQICPPPTVVERRKDLRGFILGAYRIDRIAQQALGTLRSEGIVVRLYDHAAGQPRVLYCSQSAPDAELPAKAELSHREPLEVANLRWEIDCAAVPGYVAARRTWQPWIVLTAGLALTGFLAAWFLGNVRAAVRIEQLVIRRTHELRQTERDLRTVLDTLPVGIALVDAEQQCLVDVNPVAVAMLGGTKEQIVGRHCQSMICSARCGVCPVVTAGAAVRNRECSLRMANGESVPVLKTVIPIALSGKNYMLETLIDISERRRMEDALRASEQKFRTIADSALDAVVMLHPSGNVLHWNPAAESILGYSRAEVLGRPVYDLLSPQHHAYARETLRRIAQGGRESVHGTTVELTAVHKNGMEIPVEISVAVIPMDDQWGAVVVGRDITTRKAAELELQRRTVALESANRALRDAKQAAESANHAKSEFLTNMSHELRTPLHGILSFAALGMRRNQSLTPEERLEYFQLIHQSGNTLLELINALLDLAKLEAGRMDFNFERLDLSVAIPEVVDELRSLAQDRRLKVEFHCSTVDTWVQADRVRLLQVVRNLLSNAIKFASPEGTIEIEVMDRDACLAVAVRDRGVGIPEEELTSIFDKFMQSSKTRTGAGGTGLGLAICREIVEAHGGRIEAENRKGGGAVVTFEIPRQRPPAALVAPADCLQNLPQPTTV